jgi:membrane associated rhomboid family serine protease
MALRINIPPLTRALLVLLVGLSIVYQILSYRGRPNGTLVSWITLTPQLSIYYPWVYVTATFAEHNVLTLLVAGSTLLYGGRYLERAWTSTEFGKFLLVVILIPNFVASIIYVIIFAILRVDSSA